MTPTLTPFARTIATICAAILSCALALGFGDYVGSVVHGTDTATSTTPAEPAAPPVYELPDTTTDSSPVYGPEHVDCAPLVLDEDTDYTHLIDAGYWGDPDDGMEALYAPECR